MKNLKEIKINDSDAKKIIGGGCDCECSCSCGGGAYTGGYVDLGTERDNAWTNTYEGDERGDRSYE